MSDNNSSEELENAQKTKKRLEQQKMTHRQQSLQTN